MCSSKELKSHKKYRMGHKLLAQTKYDIHPEITMLTWAQKVMLL